MPANEFEWFLVFVGLGFVLGSTVATALVVMQALKNTSIHIGVQRIVALILLVYYSITGLYLLPFVFQVAEKDANSLVAGEIGFAFAGLMTLVAVVLAFNRLLK